MKKLISILLALVMVLGLFAGCSSNAGNDKTANTDSQQSEGKNGKSGEKPYEVRMIIAIPATVPDQDDVDRITAAINEITLPELNMTLKLEPLPYSVYNEQINLELSSGAKLDLTVVAGTRAGTYVNSG